MPGNHQVFVRLHDADRHPRAVAGDDGRMLRIAPWVQVDAEEVQAGADARAHRRGVLPDPAREDEGVEPAQGGGERPQELAGLVAEELDRLGRAWVVRFLVEQVAHVRTDTRDT